MNKHICIVDFCKRIYHINGIARSLPDEKNSRFLIFDDAHYACYMLKIGTNQDMDTSKLDRDLSLWLKKHDLGSLQVVTQVSARDGQLTPPIISEDSNNQQLAYLCQLTNKHQHLAYYHLRLITGLPAVPNGFIVQKWLQEHTQDLASITAVNLVPQKLEIYNFSIHGETNSALEGNQKEQATKMFSMLEHNHKCAGIGRYLEDRRCYRGPQFSVANAEPRTVHLGVDIFMPADTPLYAPLDGIVYGLADNAAAYDYGPTIILKHQPEDGVTFFTLYGHLSRQSLSRHRVNDVIKQGQKIATIGTHDVNGGWIPHVHFQLILDMLDEKDNYIGVCSLSQQELWSAICPNPNLILRIPKPVSAI